MLYDISPPITERLKVWPGDTPPAREVLCHIRSGQNITLSTLHGTVHLGAHADAPSHYSLDGPGIGERSLDYFLGACQVVRVPVGPGALVVPESLGVDISAPRVLFATGTFPDPETFNEDFAALAPQLIDWLHDRGVLLVGVDTPSVDPFPSKELAAHKSCLKHDMAILEGLVLAHVPEATYELIALPLRLMGFDASPVRAILRTLP